MHWISWARLAPLLLAGLLPGAVNASGPVPGVTLAAHRAVYQLSLVRSDTSGAVVALRGRLALEFTDVCDGFTLNQRIRTERINAEGGRIDSDFSITSWESRDGTKFRFNLKHEFDGRSGEEFVGRAELRGPGKGGLATFAKPAGEQLDLPPGTMFPTEHVAILVKEARAGKTSVPVKIFDGSAEDGVYDVGSFIGKPLPPETGNNALLAPLKGLRSWNVRLAYFPTTDQAAKPEYEIGFRLFENGVTENLILDYGDFAMKGDLALLEMLPAGGC